MHKAYDIVFLGYPNEWPSMIPAVNGWHTTLPHGWTATGSHSPQLYSVIFVGAPNWCGTIAPPMASWLSRHNLSGKIILPLYSHCGGVAGDLRHDIAALCPKADVREALRVIYDGREDLTELVLGWLQRTGAISVPIRQTV